MKLIVVTIIAFAVAAGIAFYQVYTDEHESTVWEELNSQMEKK